MFSFKKLSYLKVFISCLIIFFLSSCTTKSVIEKEYTSSGELTSKSIKVNDETIKDIKRIFHDLRIEGTGVFESENEGLARRTAINLAVAELASQVQTKVKSESTIYNNKDVREIIENRTHAYVRNYKIESSGYDPGTKMYRVRVSINGEELIKEIEIDINK